MKNVYHLLSLFGKIKNRRIKLLGIYLLHIFSKRYIGIFLDPIIACNFRCRMCYFSDSESKTKEHKKIDVEDIELIANSIFHRALKLQIGCGAEPTLYKNLLKIISLGKQHRIPYISITTNGALITKDLLSKYAEAGLNEITLSLHGLKKETYDFFMTNGKFEHIPVLLKNIAEVKQTYPELKLRINYTINQDNLFDLVEFNSLFNKVPLDIIQLRPIQKIGNSVYNNFSTQTIVDNYECIITPIINECKREGIICIVPSPKNILAAEKAKESDNSIEEATYCYVSPTTCWQKDFDYKSENFESYSKRKRVSRQLFKSIFITKKKQKKDVTTKLNYSIK